MTTLIPLVAALAAVGFTQYFAWKLNELNKRIERDRKLQENYAKWMGYFFSFISIRNDRFIIEYLEIPELEALIDQNRRFADNDAAEKNLQLLDELKKECNDRGKELYETNCKLHEAEALIYFNEESTKWKQRFQDTVKNNISMTIDIGDALNSARAKVEELKKFRAAKIKECKEFAQDHCQAIAASHKALIHDKRLALWVGISSAVCLLIGLVFGNLMSPKPEVLKVQIVTSNGNTLP